MNLLMLLGTSSGLTQDLPVQPVVTTADQAAMRAACVRYGRTLTNAATRPAQLKRCAAMIPAAGTRVRARVVAPSAGSTAK